jgi:lipopolysaccharide transport system ATP-binding protein
MSTVIKIENLSKQYRLGLVTTRTLRNDLNRWWQMNIRRNEDPYLMIGQENRLSSGSLSVSYREPDARRLFSSRRLKPDARGLEEYVWALKDINPEVQQGEVPGVINLPSKINFIFAIGTMATERLLFNEKQRSLKWSLKLT